MNPYVGKREKEARLANAAQVSEREDEDAGERECDLVRRERREDRGDREDAGGHGDRHGQDVVRQERGCGDESGHSAEVLLREDVGAAARLIDGDALPVGEDDDEKEGAIAIEIGKTRWAELTDAATRTASAASVA